MTKINFEIPYLEFSENFVIENNGKSTVIFGSNGMGKTSIYNAIKKQHDEFDYVDYTNMKNAFLNGKAKEINVTPHIQEYNNLLIERINIGDSLDITDSLKRFDINSGPKVRMVAPMLNEVQRTKQVDSKITISESNHARLSGTSDSDIRFLSQYFDGLKEISDIEDDIKSLKEEYLKDVLKHLDDNINESTKICPVCSSEVPDLKLIIQRKIKSAKLIKNEFLINFKEINNSTKNEQIIERFNHLLTLAKDFTLQDITDYILVPNFEKIAMINKGVKQKKRLESQIKESEKKVEVSYTNLKTIEKSYTSYISRKFGVDAIFRDEEFSIVIKLERHPSEYSTGEFNLILFVTKIFEFVGSDKKLMILDDPISSYDIINQYKIAFDIVASHKQNEKNFLIFTHNMSLINLINSQRRGIFEYKMIEKIDGIIHLYDFISSDSDSILNIYKMISNAEDNLNLKLIRLCLERDTPSVSEEVKNKIHPLFHYDGSYQFDMELHDFYDEGLTNDYLTSLVNNINYTNFDKENYTELVMYKIVLMLGLRVWIEGKLFDALNSDQSYLKLDNFGKKINYALPKEATSRVIDEYPELSRSDLMERKVMLNQHEHYMSQGEPFYYVMNLSVDDIYKEITEIKELFTKTTK